MTSPPSTAILSIGYDVPRLLDGAPPVQTFSGALERDDLDGVAQVIEAALERSPHALVIYPEWLREPSLGRLETIRAALATDRLALYGSTLPPLAGGVLCNLASALTAHLTRTGQIVAALDDLTRELVVAAWLGSVSGLKTPSPSLWQHLGSMLPRSGYGVVLQPTALVVRLGKRADALPSLPARRPRELAIAACDGADTSWLTEVVGPALGGTQVRIVEPTHHGADWWGSARVAEAVAYPTAIAELARELGGRHRMRLCGWCSRAIASTPCPFCRGVAGVPEPAGAADRQP